MSQQIIQDLDFVVGATVANVRTILYSGIGAPVNGFVTPANEGALYVDTAANQIWQATNNYGSYWTWLPFASVIKPSITIDTDVQEGDLVGVFGAGAWATGANLNTTRQSAAGAGSQNAALTTGGTNGSGIATNSTELFNGSIWTASGNLNTTRNGSSGAGSQNAALTAGGFNGSSATTNSTELFNGSIWTASGNLNTTRDNASGAGSQNAALTTGGSASSVTLSSTELFNGSTWAASGNLNTSRDLQAGAGSQNAALMAGGFTTAVTNTTELFNGSTWSVSGALITATDRPASAGSQNAAWMAGGRNSSNTTLSSTELFNGSVWSTSGTLNTARNTTAGAGSQNAALIAGGLNSAGTTINSTELHSQTIYRKLTYPGYRQAANIGMAFNTSTTNLSASLMQGDLPSTYICPYSQGNTSPLTAVYNNNFFGISKFNNDQGTALLAGGLTVNVVEIPQFSVNQAQLLLFTSLSFFFVGMTLNVTTTATNSIPAGNYIVVGGQAFQPIVRWVGATSVAPTGVITVTPAWGRRVMGLTTSTITPTTLNSLPALTITFDTTILSNAQFTRLVRVGDVVQIPYAATSGATGSQYHYGTFVIQSVGTSAVTVYEYNINNQAISETVIGNVSILQQIVHSSVCLDDDAVFLGLNGVMHQTHNRAWDDAANGLI